jgi:hypothetical protein
VCGEKGISLQCKLVQPLQKIGWRFCRILKIILLCDPAIPLLRIHPKEVEPICLVDKCIFMLIAEFFYYYSFIHMCIHCLGHFCPLPPSLTLSPFPPSVPGRSCSAFITNFVEEKTPA